MRNLKRALSLTLASVMLLGMMVVGSSAAQGYDDVSKDDNVEAIEVLQAIEVMVGDERGFGPERPVNRAEMAVVMALLLNLDYNYYVSSCPFGDVYDWARGPVGACYANGIVSGRGDGIYDPGATVTAVEAASMLMRALGYFRYQNDYEGNFQLSTVKQGSKIRIFDGVGSSATEPMTRNQVAQMVLNALRTGMAEPDGNTINLTTPDGSVFTGKVNYVNVTSNKPFAQAISKTRATSVGSTNDGYIVELGEQLYDGKLKLDEYTTDAFQRPARHWEFDGKDIGTYVKKELLREEYTAKVTGRDLYDLLTKPTIEDYDFVIAIDGETTKAVLDPDGPAFYGYFTKGNLVRTNTEAVGATGNGVLTQVFVDPDEGANGTVYIAIINTYLAKATGDYSEKKEEVSYDVWNLGWQGSGRQHLVKNDTTNVNLTVKAEDFDIAEVKEDDIVLVHVAEGEIKEIFDPEVIDNTEISAFKNGDWVNAAGTQYDYASSARYDTEVLDEYDQNNMKDTTYRIYLDEYGYMIGIEIIEEASNYLFLTGVDTNAYNLGNKRAEANVIFTDGTSDTVTINLEKSKAYKSSIKWKYDQAPTFTADAGQDPFTDFVQASLWNTWCVYTVDEKGVYTLTEVASTPASFTTDDGGATWNGVKRSVDKVGQGHNNAVLTDTIIDTKRIGLDGINVPGYTTVYGNDESIYITASLSRINEAKGRLPVYTGSADIAGVPQSVIIDGVDSVVTGVRNASLDVWTLGQINGNADYTIAGGNTANNASTYAYNTSNGVYTLFNDKGYVIAAVVVGEDNGTSSNYAYVYGDWSDPKGAIIEESFDKETKNWTWKAQAIVNGEDVVLTEVGDSVSELKTVRPNNWYEIKYKADGTVKNVTAIARGTADTAPHTVDAKIFCTDANSGDLTIDTATHISPASTKYPKFVGKIEFVKQANIDNDGKLVLFEDLTTNDDSVIKYRLSAKANTLQVTTNTGAYGTDKGFSVSPNAKVWLFQDNWANVSNDYKRMDTMIDCGNGQSGLNKAITELNLYDYQTNKGEVEFNGWVSAVFEGGQATTVIIYEINAGLIDQGTESTTPNGQVLDNKATVAEVNAALEKGDVFIKDSWAPRPVAGEVRTVYIPRGTTLTIERDFDAVYQDVSVHLANGAGVGTLVVNGVYTMAYNTSDTVNYNVEAGSMRILREDGRVDSYSAATIQPYGVTIDSTVTVKNGLTIQDATEESPMVYELKVARGGKLIVKAGGVSTMKYDDRRAPAGTDTVNVWVDGHMEVNGTMVPNGYVTYNNSLIVRGTMSGNLVLNRGKAEVTTMSGTVKMQNGSDVLIIGSSITGGITQVTEGAKITIKANATATGSAATSLPPASSAQSKDVTYVVAADAGSAEETEAQQVPTEAVGVTDDTSATITIGSDANNIVTITNTNGKITVTADLNDVAAKINADENLASFNPSSPVSLGGFGISPISTGANRVCVGITWKPATREGKNVSQCDVYKLVDGVETLIATSDSESEKYDSDTKTTGSTFWPHFGVIKNTAASGQEASYAYDGSSVSAPATYVIKWTYSDGVVVTQTRTVDFTLTPVTPAP